MSNCILLGDPHLGKSLAMGKAGVGSNLNSRVSDQLDLFNWTLDQAKERQSNSIIITGDVFEDPKPHPALIALFMSWLKECGMYGIDVHIIIGNHDILRSGFIYTSPLDIINEADLPNVNVYKDTATITIENTSFTLLPFRDRKSFNTTSNADAVEILKNSLVYELNSIPLTHQKVVIGHFALEGSIPIGDEIDDIANELFCPIDMFNGYDYVWMGHVHKPQILNQSNPHVAHIGSMDVSNFGETNHKKHIIVLDCDEKHNWTTETLPTRSLKKIAIQIPPDTEDSTEYVMDELRKLKSFDKSIVKVDISLGSPELKSVNKSTIEKYLFSQGVFNITGVSESKKILLVKKDAAITLDTKMDVAATIKIYAEACIEKDKQAEFLELATEIHNQFKEKNAE
jgi:exonuclease SbcD